MSFQDEVHSFLANYPDTEVVEVLTTDINGVFRGKQYPASGLVDMGAKGVTLPLSTLLFDAQGGVPVDVFEVTHPGDPDNAFVAIPGTLCAVPWSDHRAAQVLVEARARDGSRESWCPRAALVRILETLAKDGLHPVVAVELEFYLLDPKSIPPKPAAPPSGLPKLEGPQCLSMEAFHDFAPFIREVEAACKALGVPVTSILSEYGDGQFEANLKHNNNVLRACDEAMLLKRAIKEVARKRGLLASFMAKPLADCTGNGLHVHTSVLDSHGSNVFGVSDGEKRLEAAVGGIVASLPESIALIAPNANSYRRFQEGFFVPTQATWGENHRSVAIRLPLADATSRRLEHRVAGADACPYLVVAALLAGLHHGINNDLKPHERIAECERLRPAPEFPIRWREALNVLENGDILSNYLGEDFVTIYLRTKRNEEARFNAEVSDRDYAWYLRVV